MHYYATEEKIRSNWTAYTNISGRTIYKKPVSDILDTEDEITLEFKYSSVKNTYSLSNVLGIDLNGGSEYSIKFALLCQKYSRAYSYYSSNSSYRNKEGTSTSLSSNSVYKMVYKNGQCTWYKDDVQFAQYSIENTSSSSLRFDYFGDNDTSHLEYLIIL